MVYAIALDRPSTPLIIKSMGKSAGLFDRKIATIRLLGSNEKVEWSQDEAALTLQPPSAGSGEYAWAYRIELQ